MPDFGKDWKKIEPLLKKIVTCTSSKCELDGHSFRTNMRKKANREQKKTFRNGSCVDCGAKLVDWKRIDKKNLKDSEYLISSLNHELIRKKFWGIDIDDKALTKASEKTIPELKEEIEKILRKALTKPSKKQFRDGIQTKKMGNVIFYAQHATATCCRKCLEEWYDIDRNKKLDEENLKYLIEIVMIYLEKRLPHLNKIEAKN